MVNLEQALCLSDRLGGHLVSGHVDGLGRVISIQKYSKSWDLKVSWENDDFYPHTCRKSTFWVTQTAQTLQNLNFLDKCEDKNHHFFKFSDFFEFFAIFPILQIYFVSLFFYSFLQIILYISLTFF